MNKPFKVAIATFSHPYVYGTDDAAEVFVGEEFNKMKSFLEGKGFETVSFEDVLDPERPRFGIADNAQAEQCAAYLKSKGAEVLVIHLCKWTNPHMCAVLMKDMDLPCAVYTTGGIHYPGETTAAAIFGSTTESPVAPRCCRMMERFRDSEQDEIISWIIGCASASRLKKQRILSWGGTYGANIPFTREDEALLEDTLVREVIYESEEYINDAALKMVKENPERVEKFVNWLKEKGTKIVCDGCMLNDEVLKLQAGQYLAARDRLKHYSADNIAGVSFKCHFETSTECLGCTACFLPAFLPFGEDSEGVQDEIPTACEGDLKGAVTSAILHTINPDCPPLFGDVIAATKDNVRISNCGSSSAYWAGRSKKSEENLSKVEILPQQHGKSGGAVKYLAAKGEVTIARLFRYAGKYYMYFGAGVIDVDDYAPSNHGTHWPQALIRFNNVDHKDIFRTVPAQHLAVTEGDITEALEYYCRYLGIGVVRCDNPDSLREFRNNR